MNAVSKALSLLSALLLAGCNSGSDIDTSKLCPESDAAVNYAASSFTVSENLQRSYAYYVLAAMQPGAAVETEKQSAIDKMEGFIHDFIHYEGPESAITSVTNELDLLESIIASDEVDNFYRAKATMVKSIDEDLPCGYNNSNIRIAATIGDVLQEKFYILSYQYSSDVDKNPDTVTPLLTKTLVHKNITGSSTQLTPLAVLKMDLSNFNDMGYNPPVFLEARYGDATNSSLFIRLDRENKKDMVTFNSSTAFALNADYSAVKRLRFETTYESDVVKIFLSDFLKAYKLPDDSIIKDPDANQLKALNEQHGEENVKSYADPNFDDTDEIAASPVYTYQGTLVARQLN